MTQSLSPQQQALYEFIEQHAPIGPSPEINIYQAAGALAPNRLVAHLPIGPAYTDATLVLSLPQHTTQVYLAITDHFDRAFCELIARFDAESESNDALSMHTSMKLHHPFFNQVGWHAVLFTPVSEMIENFPESVHIEGETYFFKLITLLTQSEFEFAQRRGSITLMQELCRQHRNFLKFIQPTWHFMSDKLMIQAPSIKTTSSYTSDESKEYSRKIHAAMQQNRAKQILASSPPAQPEPTPHTIENIVNQVLKSIGTENKKSSLKTAYPFSQFQTLSISEKIMLIGEIILGFSLVVGGLLIGLLLMKTRFPMAGFFPIIFALAGGLILISAYRGGKS